MIEWTEKPNDEKQYAPQSSTSEVIKASSELMFKEGLTFSYVRAGEMEYAMEQGPVFSPEDIKKDLDIDVDIPMSKQAAILSHDAREEKRRLQEIVANGPRTFFSGTVAPFLGGIIGAVRDPADFAIGAALGAGFGTMFKGIKVARAGGNIGFKQGKGLKTAWGIHYKAAPKKKVIGDVAHYGVDLIGNIVGNTITEVKNMEASALEQQALAADEVLKNIIIGSIGITTAMHGLKHTFGKVMSISGQTQRSMMNITEMADELGVDTVAIDGIAIGAAARDLELDEPFVKAIKNIFGEEEAAKIDADSTVITVKESLLDNATPEQKDAFMQTLEAEGYEMRKTWLLEDEPVPHYDEATLKEMDDALKDPKLKKGYNEEVEMVEKAPESESHVIEEDVAKDYETLKEFETEELRAIDAEGNDISKQVDAAYKKVAKEDTVAMKAFDIVAKCAGMK